MNKMLPVVSLIFLSFAAGCEKNDMRETTLSPSSENSVNSQVAQVDSQVSTAFQQADEKITHFLDQLENPDLAISVKEKILCQDFPRVYQQDYIPALTKLSSENTQPQQLQQELEFTLNYYQQMLQIRCP